MRTLRKREERRKDPIVDGGGREKTWGGGFDKENDGINHICRISKKIKRYFSFLKSLYIFAVNHVHLGVQPSSAAGST